MHLKTKQNSSFFTIIYTDQNVFVSERFFCLKKRNEDKLLHSSRYKTSRFYVKDDQGDKWSTHTRAR